MYTPLLQSPLTVKQLMYGFGDVPNPSNDAVGVLEDMLIEYLTDTVSILTFRLFMGTSTNDSSFSQFESLLTIFQCTAAAGIADKRGKVNVEDFKFVLRKDAKKRARVDELLYMNEDIRRAKKLADIPEFDNTKGGAKDPPI
ncbi:hypothetical protein BGZ98_003414 [Dissophora globulifera]|nr:hypothetical protein BGZ98_003414 [Dissophora globulifera]